MPTPWMPKYQLPGITNAKGFPTSGFGQPGGLPPGGTLGELPSGSSTGIIPGAPGQGQSVNYPNGWSVTDGKITSGPGISTRGSTPLMTPAMQTLLGGGAQVRTAGPAQVTGNPFPFGLPGGQNRSWSVPTTPNPTAPPPQQPPAYNPQGYSDFSPYYQPRSLFGMDQNIQPHPSAVNPVATTQVPKAPWNLSNFNLLDEYKNTGV